ncbi:hypothetical protein INS49_004776 [Diaporthe citri]|uniref:uncharacterized protein n=1 Tax=Diaporthe citri TaxID=83186 RepID=UPI001C8140A7|nr:uncharacterized protein INS49_004776 [Diaporthe citri]KAG6354172.1 hypothetical protein INS49_004776 [Diaporthe citri]
MRKTLRRMFGARPKSAMATLPRTKHPNPNRASAPPAFGRVRSVDEPATYIVPGPFDNDMQCQAPLQRVRMTAQENTSQSRMASRTSQFGAAERSLQANFPQTRVVDAGQFPGNMELLDGVRKDDTRFFVAMNPEDSSQYIAVNLVIFRTTETSQLGCTSPGVRPIVVAQDALAHLLRQWQRGGVSDRFLAIVSMGTESSVQVFRAKEGLVDLPA